jgi:hypothetical protein
MKTFTVVRIIGWLQLGLSILLAIATGSVYTSYRASVRDMSHSLANAVVSVSDVISKVATGMEVRQELIDDAAEVLVASRKLVADLKGSAETQEKLLPRYAASLKDGATLMAEVADTMTRTGNQLKSFKLPTGFHFEGRRAAWNWIYPLESHGQELLKNSGRATNLSTNLSSLAGSLSIDAPKLNAGLIDVSQKTLKGIDQLAGSMKKLKSQELPLAIASMKAIAEHLRQASKGAKDVEEFATKLLYVGLLLTLLFAFNSVGVLLLVQSLSSDSAKASDSVRPL